MAMAQLSNTLSVTPTPQDLHTFQQELRRDTGFLDVKIRVEDKDIDAHKVVLATHSPFLRSMCHSQNYITLDTLKYDAVRKIIEYFYSLRLELNITEAQDAMTAVIHLQVDSLRQKIADYVLENLHHENCISWFIFADEIKMPTVRDRSREMMFHEFKEAVRSDPAFCALDYRKLKIYLTTALANRASFRCDVNDVLEASFRWITYDTSSRRCVLEDILSYMPLNDCSQRMLKHIMETYGGELITEFHVLQMFTSAILTKVSSWQPNGNSAGEQQ